MHDAVISNVFYYCFDGDRIGESIQLCIMNDDIDGVTEIARNVKQCAAHIVQIMDNSGAECIFVGGDSLIFCSKNDICDQIIPHIFENISFSVGIGGSLSKAALSLFRAKALGRCRIERDRS